MRAQTEAGLYGVDIPFKSGLNVLWADNTMGKSTCMQGMLYALGMEKMLSPRREVPLPYAMTSFLKDINDISINVLESSVALEIENGAGNIVTIRRPVKREGVDNRLMTVDFGPSLTDKISQFQSRDFFNFDPGAAQREDGFHFFLEDFIGWRLPTVRRYDSPDCKLYIETVFPLFWVEQKSGWSAIPAAIPTYFRIREVQKRAVEFILELDVQKIELERQRLQELLDGVIRDWRVIWDDLDRFARRSGATIENLPDRPTLVIEQLSRGYLMLLDEKGSVALSDLVARLRRLVADLLAESIPNVEEVAGELTDELAKLNREIETANRARIAAFAIKQLKDADISSLKRRTASLAEDLQKNQDVQKLRRYSGTISALTPERCPTCDQSLADTLLPQEQVDAIMPIEENIEYIRSQMRMFGDILERETHRLIGLEVEAVRADQTLRDLYSRARSIRSDLIAPSGNPSAVAVEKRVTAEARIRELDEMQAAFDNARERLESMAVKYAALISARDELPKDRFSSSDSQKMRLLSNTVQRLSGDFGFSTFKATEITIDEDTYRPQKEGYEIGFETSASDAIRLKWAYQLALLDVSDHTTTNHPNMLLFDEPRQQSSSRVSFVSLLERAASYQRHDQQVIVSTSEDIETIKEFLSRVSCSNRIFSGYVLKRI